jgi:hypothetical protein
MIESNEPGRAANADTGSNHLQPLEGMQMANQYVRTKLSLREYLNERSVPAAGGCRLWALSQDGDGYGSASWDGKAYKAHRLSWIEENGRPIPDGKIVCHRCDVRHCIEPSHLWVGNDFENAADRSRKGRHSHGPAHAKTFSSSPKWLASLPRGSAHENSKITETQALAIRADVRFQKDIAADYGVSQSLVSLIKRGKLWAHV